MYTVDQLESINYLKRFGIVTFNGFIVYIEEQESEHFGYDYSVSFQPEEGFDQDPQVEPFLPTSLVGKVEAYTGCIYGYDGNIETLRSELTNSPHFKIK